MSYHAAVWIDHSQAKVFHIDREGSIEDVLKGPKHHRERGSAEMEHFFHDVVKAVSDAQEILVCGPGSAKLELIRHVHRHDKPLEARIAERLRGLRERARAQRMAEEGEQRLMLALWGTGDELWDMDLADGSMVRVNPLQHLKVTHEVTGSSWRTYEPYLHPDDRAAFHAAVGAHMRGQTEFLEATYRTQDRDGKW